MTAHGGDETDAAAIEAVVQEAFAAFVHDGQVRVPAVVNMFICNA